VAQAGPYPLNKNTIKQRTKAFAQSIELEKAQDRKRGGKDQ
jgi:hypothetical protein